MTAVPARGGGVTLNRNVGVATVIHIIRLTFTYAFIYLYLLGQYIKYNTKIKVFNCRSLNSRKRKIAVSSSNNCATLGLNIALRSSASIRGTNFKPTSSSAIAEGPRDALSQLKSRQLLHSCTKNHI